MVYVPNKQLQEIGYQAIYYFHNENATRNPREYRISIGELQRVLESRTGGKAFLEGLGLAINNVDMKTADVADAMKDLAKKAQGKIPSTNGQFYSALKDEATSFSFSSLGDVSLDIAKDIAEKAASGGQKVLDVAGGVADSAVSISGNLKWILPITLFLIIVGYFWMKNA